MRGRQLEAVSEFGPFHLLSAWAHALYVAGRHDEAIQQARGTLLVVDRAGDRLSGLYALYVQASCHYELGEHDEALATADQLLARIDRADEPYWRAKALAIRAVALIASEDMDRAMDALAEADTLLRSHPSQAYNYFSGRIAVAIVMSALYLYEQAIDVLRTTRSGDEVIDAYILEELGRASLGWAAALELAGRTREARARYVETLSVVVKTMNAADRIGHQAIRHQCEVAEAFVLERLGHPEIAEATVRRIILGSPIRDELVEAHLARLTLARVLGQRGEVDTAREHAILARRSAARAARDVWAGTAVLVEAALDEAELGTHPAVARLAQMSQRLVGRIWEDRASRFLELQSRSRVVALVDQTERMGREVLVDPLTGLGNRRRLVDAFGPAEIVSAIFIDLDHFKQVNDTFGHQVGDEVLRTIGAVLNATFRAGDVLVRYGGDEFLVLLAADVDVDAVEGLGRRVLDAVRTYNWFAVREGLQVTVSVGVATALARDSALAAADRALYQAKRAGRDRVVSVD